MADIVNLRQVRKHKARAGKKTQAAENRTTFGRTKTHKLRQTLEAEQTRKHLDGHKRERDDK